MTADANSRTDSGSDSESRKTPASDSAREVNSSVAIDIETISPDKNDPNPQNPDDLELLCIGVGHRPREGAPVETHVLMRRGMSPRHELELLDRLYEWVMTHRSDRLLTYNGTKFDLLHLRGRADRVERKLEGEFNAEARAKIDAFLEVHEHLDLFDIARDIYDFWPKLEEVCGDYGIEVPEVHYQGRPVDNSMIPWMGERYLISLEENNRDSDLHRKLVEYTESDIEPLFHLEEVLK
jgi:DNA polymerase elongation subunit (family B)